METSPHYTILGGPGSPYSHKLRSVLRYRRIPHVWRIPSGPPLEQNGELAKTGKDVLPILRTPEGTFHTDSTPLILDLERRHLGRSVLPEDPALAFLARLIEDFADESVVYTMFFFRWSDPADAAFCAKRQIAGWLGATPSRLLDGLVGAFSARQRSVLEFVGGPPENAPVHHHLYETLLAALEDMFEQSLFLFGSRPSLADFGLYGPLSQCAVDPTASRILRERAVRTYQWIQLLDDASGLEGEWQGDSAPGPAARSLLALIGSFHLPYLVKLAAAIEDGSSELAWNPWDLPFRRPVIRAPERQKERAGLLYQVRCLGWLRAAFAELPASAREQLRPVLEETSCWDALQASESELAAVPPLVPG